jgi:signal transduction histidine kinase
MKFREKITRLNAMAILDFVAKLDHNFAGAAPVNPQKRFYFDSEKYNLQHLFAQSPGFIAILRGPEHVFELVNDAYYQLVGHRNVINKPVRQALPELDGQGFFELLDEVYATGIAYVASCMPLSVQRLPGSPLEKLYVDFVYQPILEKDGTVSGIFCQGHDSTRQKMAQDALHKLYAHHSRIREEERKRIAREIHDHLGQNLLALNIDVSMLHARTKTNHPRLHGKVGAALDNIEGAMQTIKSLINDLRPFELELGLYAAASWLTRRFERKTGIACTLKAFPQEVEADFGLDEEMTTVAFRILQESLADITSNAHASNVEVELRNSGNEFVMKIRDNGVGFDARDRRRGNPFELLGIEERILFFGGNLVIDSNQQTGTTLTISMPVSGSARTEYEKVSDAIGSMIHP